MQLNLTHLGPRPAPSPAPCVACAEAVSQVNRHILFVHIQSYYEDGSQGRYQVSKRIGACSMECLKAWWSSPDGSWAEVCHPDCRASEDCDHDGDESFWHSDAPHHQPTTLEDGTVHKLHADWDLHFRIHFALKVDGKAVVESEAYLPTPNHINDWWQEVGMEEIEALEYRLDGAADGNRPHVIDTSLFNPPTAEEKAAWVQGSVASPRA